MLRALGLSATEEELYERLLTLPSLTHKELSTVAGDQAVIERLERLGLVDRLPGDPPRYRAAAADVALETLVAEHELALAAARRRINQLAAGFRQAASESESREAVEVVHGDDIVVTIEELFRRTRGEFRMFDAPPYIQQPGEHNPTTRLLNRGVRCRVIYDRSGVDFPGRLPDIDESVTAGEEARVTELPMKLGIGDDSMAVMPLRPCPVSIDSWLVVHDAGLLAGLTAMFEMYWTRAVPLQVKRDRTDGAVCPGGSAPDETDRMLLPLLAAGLTDQAIAHHLGLHERTAHRYLRAMMRRLDASTRFQAGYQAVRRGWLTTPEDGDDHAP